MDRTEKVEKEIRKRLTYARFARYLHLMMEGKYFQALYDMHCEMDRKGMYKWRRNSLFALESLIQVKDDFDSNGGKVVLPQLKAMDDRHDWMACQSKFDVNAVTEWSRMRKKGVNKRRRLGYATTKDKPAWIKRVVARGQTDTPDGRGVRRGAQGLQGGGLRGGDKAGGKETAKPAGDSPKA